LQISSTRSAMIRPGMLLWLCATSARASGAALVPGVPAEIYDGIGAQRVA